MMVDINQAFKGVFEKTAQNQKREDQKTNISATIADSPSPKRYSTDTFSPESEELRKEAFFSKINVIDQFNIDMIDPHSQVAEEFRILKTKIADRFPENNRVFMITSCHHKEGKSTVALYTALHIAKNPNNKVILIEGDLRRPKIAKFAGIKTKIDIVDVIMGRAQLSDVLIYSKKENLTILPAKREYSNAVDILENSSYPKIIEEIKKYYNYVIIDTSPILSTADPFIIGKSVPQTLLVIRSRHTQRESISHAIQLITEAGIEIKGIVLTYLRFYIPKYLYRYQYYHSYYYYDEE